MVPRMMIRSFFHYTFLFLILMGFLLAGVPVEASRPYYEEEAPALQRRWYHLLRPAESGPTAQLQHANELREAERYWRAQRQYRALARYWPTSQEAVQAQFSYARVQEEREKWTRAFDGYERLLDEYAGLFAHAQVLERMFGIAEHVMERRRAQFLFFPGFHAPERALPLFETIVEYGPHGEHAPEAQFQMGRIQEDLGRLDEAIFSYERVETRYPRDLRAVEAAFAKGRSLYRMTRRHPNDLDGAETAYYTLALFVQNHPQSPDVEEARDYMEEIRGHMAKLEYEKARFYDRMANEPQAALVVYRRFVERFPDSKWGKPARQRIEELESHIEEPDV